MSTAISIRGGILKWCAPILAICVLLWPLTGCAMDIVPAGEKLTFNSPRLSQDGNTVIFSFTYGPYKSKLALVETQNQNSRIVLIKAPPTLNWLEANWSPDMKYFAAVSYCAGNDSCYEDATGFNIWRFSTRDNEILKLTENYPDLQRGGPIFDDQNAVYYVARHINDIPGHGKTRGDFFVHKIDGQKDLTIFPSEKIIPNARYNFKISNFSLYSLSSPRPLPNGDFLFVGTVVDKDFFEREIKPAGIPQHDAVLLRYSRGAYFLEKKISVTNLAMGSANSTKFFAVAQRQKTKLVSFRVDAETDTTTTPVFEFPGTYFTSLSVTADGNKFAFFGNVDYGEERDIWTYDATSKEMRRLNIGSRLRAALLADLELERYR